jgi:hypothetical protein
VILHLRPSLRVGISGPRLAFSSHETLRCTPTGWLICAHGHILRGGSTLALIKGDQSLLVVKAQQHQRRPVVPVLFPSCATLVHAVRGQRVHLDSVQMVG